MYGHFPPTPSRVWDELLHRTPNQSSVCINWMEALISRLVSPLVTLVDWLWMERSTTSCSDKTCACLIHVSLIFLRWFDIELPRSMHLHTWGKHNAGLRILVSDKCCGGIIDMFYSWRGGRSVHLTHFRLRRHIYKMTDKSPPFAQLPPHWHSVNQVFTG